jgi:hypothetical protein
MINPKLFCLSVLVFCGVCLSACGGGTAYTPVPTPNTVQRAERIANRSDAPVEQVNRFGVIEGFWFPDLTCELGVGWERIIFNWEQHQPTKPDDWHTLNVDDRWLAAADACNREVVALLKYTPAWATDGLTHVGVPRGLDLPIDDPDNLWANFVRQAVTYYKGRMGRGVTHFIIWNEPDIEAGTYGYEFGGDLDDYYQFLKVAYLAAKEANPDAVIHLAGTTYWHDVNEGRQPYMERLIERIMQDPEAAEHDYYFDVLSLHIYFRVDTIYDITREMRTMLDAHGLADKRIWINETNAAPTDDPQWKVERPQFQQVDLEQQAAYLVQAAALALAADVERVAVYKLYDQQLPPGAESFGILSPVDALPRPAFFAWQMVAERFNEVESAALARTKTADVVTLTYPDGRVLIVAWARTDAAVQLDVTAAGDSAKQVDLYGTNTDVSPVDGMYRLNLVGARCDAKEGCYIGGPVVMLMQPSGDFQVYEVSGTTRTELNFEQE